MNYHGDFVSGMSLNNQLLSYNPNTNNWVNPNCFGSVPSPRLGHASAIIRDNVFLFRGCIQNWSYADDFYQMNMNSLTWTQLMIGQPSPQARCFCSLTATSDNKLVLHGGQSTQEGALNDTWIMDPPSYSWRLHMSWGPRLQKHTATPGLNSNVIIIGGCKDMHNTYNMYNNFMVHVMLEPKRFQELDRHTIYKHHDDLPWKLCLPARSLQELATSTVFKYTDDLTWKHLPKALFYKSGYCFCCNLNLPNPQLPNTPELQESEFAPYSKTPEIIIIRLDIKTPETAKFDPIIFKAVFYILGHKTMKKKG